MNLHCPRVSKHLSDGTELRYTAFLGDAIVTVFTRDRPAQLVAEVNRIETAQPRIALPNPRTSQHLDPFSEEIRATAVDFYNSHPRSLVVLPALSTCEVRSA